LVASEVANMAFLFWEELEVFKSLLLGTLVIAATAGLCPAAETAQLEELGWLIGTWETEIVLEEDSADGRLKKGTKLTIQLDCPWALAHHAVRVEMKVNINGTTVKTSNALIGFNAAKKQLVGYGFDSSGDAGQSVWSKTKSGWQRKLQEVKADGSKASETTVVTEISSDSFTSQATNRKHNGEEQPDHEKLVWKRIK
jgi:hypothetical protein